MGGGSRSLFGGIGLGEATGGRRDQLELDATARGAYDSVWPRAVVLLCSALLDVRSHWRGDAHMGHGDRSGTCDPLLAHSTRSAFHCNTELRKFQIKARARQFMAVPLVPHFQPHSYSTIARP